MIGVLGPHHREGIYGLVCTHGVYIYAGWGVWVFLPCTLERIFVGWGIHMVCIYGARVIVFAQPPP